jgi:hypothetical protein
MANGDATTLLGIVLEVGLAWQPAAARGHGKVNMFFLALLYLSNLIQSTELIGSGQYHLSMLRWIYEWLNHSNSDVIA